MTFRAESAVETRTRSFRNSRAFKSKLKNWRMAFDRLEERWLMSTLSITSGVLVYDGGVTASDITVAASGSNAVFTEADSTITLDSGALSAGWSGSGTNTVTGPASSITSLVVQTSSTAGQHLTLDFSGGDPLPSTGLLFSPPAASPGNTNDLTLQGGTFTSETYTPSGAGAGTVTYTDSTNTNAPIVFSNLATVTDTVVATSLLFTAQSGTTALNVANGPVVGGSPTEQINDAGTTTFTTTNFANKVAVTVGVSDDGATLTLNSTTAATALANLTLHATGANATINVDNTPDALAVTITGNGGEDNLNVVHTGANGTLAIDTSGTNASNVSIIADNEPVALNLNSNATVSIGSTGGTGTMAGLDGNVSIVNLPSFYTLAFHDENDVTAHTWTLATDDLANTGSLALSTGATVSYHPNDVSGLSINGGSGGNTFNVTSTSSFIATTINTGTGSDTVHVSSTGGNSLTLNGQNGNDTVTLGGVASVGLQNLTGFITLTNTSGNTSLVLDNSQDTTGRTATLTDGGTTGVFTGLSLLSNIQYNDSAVHSVSVLLGGGTNSFTVNGNRPVISVTGGSGNDTLSVNTQSLTPSVTAGGSAGQVVVSVPGLGHVNASAVEHVTLSNTVALTVTNGSSQSINSVEGTPLTGTVISDFTIPNISSIATIGGSAVTLPAGGLISSINFNDPSSDVVVGTVTQDANVTNHYFVTANHTYATAGNFTATSSVSLPTSLTATLNGVAISIPLAAVIGHVLAPATALLSQGAIVVTPLSITGNAGIAIPAGPIASFTQAGTLEPAGNYTAQITITDSGNNTVVSDAASSITFISGPNIYIINAPNITLPVGSYHLDVSVTETASATTASNTVNIQIADAALTAGAAVSLSPTINVPLTSVTVGTFTSADPAASVGNFTALIGWGDGSSSAGTISQPGGVGTAFVVTGTHTYTTFGAHTVAVAVLSAGGATAALTGSATVTDLAVTGALNAFSAVQGTDTGTIVLGTFTSPNPAAVASDFTATLPVGGWGDGTPSTPTNLTITPVSSNSTSSTFEITGNHTYVTTGAHAVNVTVTTSEGAVTNLTSANATVAAAPITKILAITGQPRKIVAGNNKSKIVVQLKTLLKKLNKADTSAVTLTITGGGATISGTTTVNAVKGVATFKNFFFTTAGVFTITATDNFNTIVSKTITVVPAAVASLVISTPPASVIAAAAITPPITVTARDAFGNFVANKTGITLSLATAPTGGKLTGTLTAPTTNGVATFSKLILKTPGTYALKATNKKVSVTSSTFTVAAAV